MKYIFKIKFIIISLLIIKNSYSCDVCGCAISTFQVGITQILNKNFISLKLNHNSFIAHYKSLDILKTNEEFYSTEININYFIKNKIQIISSIPYNIYYQKPYDNFQKNTITNGIGDISFMAFYYFYKSKNNSKKDIENLINNKNNSSKFFQNIAIGFGIKMPTANYNNSIINNNNINSNQIGTGSWDFPLNLIYKLSYSNIGLLINSNYIITNENIYGYKYGDKIKNIILVYYNKKIYNLKINPNIGCFNEYSYLNTQNKLNITQSGYNIYRFLLGTEIQYKNFNLGFQYAIPIYYNISTDLVKINNSYNINFSYFF